MKILTLGAELFHTDGGEGGQTLYEANGRFSQFCERSYNSVQSVSSVIITGVTVGRPLSVITEGECNRKAGSIQNMCRVTSLHTA